MPSLTGDVMLNQKTKLNCHAQTKAIIKHGHISKSIVERLPIFEQHPAKNIESAMAILEHLNVSPGQQMALNTISRLLMAALKAIIKREGTMARARQRYNEK